MYLNYFYILLQEYKNIYSERTIKKRNHYKQPGKNNIISSEPQTNGGGVIVSSTIPLTLL